jgi:hypothetical protein
MSNNLFTSSIFGLCKLPPNATPALFTQEAKGAFFIASVAANGKTESLQISSLIISVESLNSF